MGLVDRPVSQFSSTEEGGRRRKWNGIFAGIYRNGYQGFLSLFLIFCLRLDGGVGTIEKTLLFSDFLKPNHIEKEVTTTWSFFSPSPQPQEETQLHIKMGKRKKKVCAVWALRSFIVKWERERERERAICRDRVNFLEPWFFRSVGARAADLLSLSST